MLATANSHSDPFAGTHAELLRCQLEAGYLNSNQLRNSAVVLAFEDSFVTFIASPL